MAATTTIKFDGLVKSRKIPFFVIPAKAGIQSIQIVKKALDSGFHRSDDFLRSRQINIRVKLRHLPGSRLIVTEARLNQLVS